MLHRLGSIPRLAVLLAGALACGGSEPAGPSPQPDNNPASLAATAGGNETVRVATAVGTLPAVVVKNQAGGVLAGVSVTFSVEAGGGTVTGSTLVTDASGLARVGSWTVGSGAGENRLKAAVTANPNLTTTFTVTARWPYWAIMVYMAADNDLAIQGILDIDEMEAAGVDPEVRVVVQAEFSPTNLALDYGCNAACFNRPNFNIPNLSPYRQVDSRLEVNPTAGQITSTRTTARQIQFGLRFTF